MRINRNGGTYKRLERLVADLGITVKLGSVTLDKPYDVATALYLRGVRAQEQARAVRQETGTTIGGAK